MTRGQGQKFRTGFRTNTAFLVALVFIVVVFEIAKINIGHTSSEQASSSAQVTTEPTSSPTRPLGPEAQPTISQSTKSRVTNWGLGVNSSQGKANATVTINGRESSRAAVVPEGVSSRVTNWGAPLLSSEAFKNLDEILFLSRAYLKNREGNNRSGVESSCFLMQKKSVDLRPTLVGDAQAVSQMNSLINVFRVQAAECASLISQNRQEQLTGVDERLRMLTNEATAFRGKLCSDPATNQTIDACRAP